MECEDVIKFGEIFWQFIIGKKNVPGTFQYGNYEQVHIEIFTVITHLSLGFSCCCFK